MPETASRWVSRAHERHQQQKRQEKSSNFVFSCRAIELLSRQVDSSSGAAAQHQTERREKLCLTFPFLFFPSEEKLFSSLHATLNFPLLLAGSKYRWLSTRTTFFFFSSFSTLKRVSGCRDSLNWGLEILPLVSGAAYTYTKNPHSFATCGASALPIRASERRLSFLIGGNALNMKGFCPFFPAFLVSHCQIDFCRCWFAPAQARPVLEIQQHLSGFQSQLEFVDMSIESHFSWYGKGKKRISAAVRNIGIQQRSGLED